MHQYIVFIVWVLNHFKVLINKIDESSFWSNFISNLFVVLLVSVFLPFYLDWQKRPKSLFFTFHNTNSNNQEATVKGENYEYSFNLIINHPRGNSFSHGVFWHLYMPKFLSPSVDNMGSGKYPREEDLGDFIHYYGYVSEPIFEGSTRELHYRFHGSFKIDIKNIYITFLYFFSTEYGLFPRKLSLFGSQLGIFNEQSMGELKLKIPSA